MISVSEFAILAGAAWLLMTGVEFVAGRNIAGIFGIAVLVLLAVLLLRKA